MKIYTDFPPGWWVILAIICTIYLTFYFLRKKRRKGELGIQLILGIVVVILAFLIEFVAVSLGIWNYVPGNWPIVLWFAYFGIGLAGFQIHMKIEEIIKR